MKILAFETSAKSVSAAVTEDGTVLAFSYQCNGLTHSRTLMPMAEELLRTSGLSMADIGLLAVAAGPGSFTGLRIGIAAVKGLAWAAELPCCGVSTLEAMAENLRHTDATLICAMDARRDQFYNALFRAEQGELRRLTPDRAIAPEALLPELREDGAPRFAVGDGAILCRDFLAAHGVECRLAPPLLRMQNAAGVALAAERYAREGRILSAQALTPIYLRMSQAERERLAREQNKAQNSN